MRMSLDHGPAAGCIPEVPLAPVGERRSGLKMVGGHPLTS
jgi:hypothetical protein